VYFQQGQITPALTEAQTAIRLSRYSSSAYTNLAFAQYALGHLSDACTAAEEAVRLVPKRDVAHYILGVCDFDRGDRDQARAEFEKFLELYWDRAYIDVYKTKAEEYLKQLK
jgi:tetratricopeptide (TPR) repeat protein